MNRHLKGKRERNIGSVVNLLYMLTLLQMHYHVTSLHNPGRMLSGFNGSQAKSLGEIMLPVTVGPTTMFITFNVLNKPSSFNIILSKTWLHAIKQYHLNHQTLSFLPISAKSISTMTKRLQVLVALSDLTMIPIPPNNNYNPANSPRKNMNNASSSHSRLTRCRNLRKKSWSTLEPVYLLMKCFHFCIV